MGKIYLRGTVCFIANTCSEEKRSRPLIVARSVDNSRKVTDTLFDWIGARRRGGEGVRFGRFNDTPTFTYQSIDFALKLGRVLGRATTAIADYGGALGSPDKNRLL